MNEKIYLLHKTTPSRHGNVADLSNMKKPTQIVKENKETEYVKQRNKTKLQNNIDEKKKKR